MAKNKEQDLLVDLIEQYDKVRTNVKQLEKEKDELNTEIKALIGDRDSVPVPGWKVTYKCDKDREVTSFDEEKFKEKAPKDYVRYCEMMVSIEGLKRRFVKTKTIPGARKLIVESGEE